MKSTGPQVGLILCLLLAATGNLRAGDTTQKPSGEPIAAIVSLDQALNWLPTDTEMVRVARGPFKVDPIPEQEPEQPLPLEWFLREEALMELSVMRQGEFLKHLVGQPVALAVEGTRRFRPPSAIGGCMFEGCLVVAFSNNPGQAGASFMNAVGRFSKAERIAGHRVLTFDQKVDSDPWHFFVARPRPDLLLCATDSSYLEEVLRRMGRQATRAPLLSTLPEWQHVDRSAPFWAVRHVPKPGSDLFLNDPELFGVVFAFDPAWGPRPRLRCFSHNKQALRLMHEAWDPRGVPFVSEILQKAPNIIEVSVKLTGKNPCPDFMLRLLCFLGHGVAL
jgi:hypothetical protein